MPRDQILRKAFEIADDGMQGVVGYFYYVGACQHIAKVEIVKDYLPKVISRSEPPTIHHMMWMFHEWVRYYDPDDLLNEMEDVFVPYHIRTCTLAIVSIFEAFLSSAIDRLVGKGKIPQVKDSYKQRLKWAFLVILNSNFGNDTMQARLPQLCLDLDHARRVRNLWMHNNGNFTHRYKNDTLDVLGHTPIVVEAFKGFHRSPKTKVPFPIDAGFFEQISRSHIEALHHLHHMMQVVHFGQIRSYGYKAAKKNIDWGRILAGV